VIHGVGIDLVKVARVEALLARRGERFLRRVFTPAERARCLGRARPAEELAARFAAKEAAFKALGPVWREGVTWKDFEVVSDARGRPHLRLHGEARRWAEERGIRVAGVSLTHDDGLAVAEVILERDGCADPEGER
jgi:holo-[acyl-carrier protein] synthase